MSRTSNSSTTLLIILMIVFTFPIWIGILGGIIGLFFGIIGGVLGLIGGLVGAILGVIAVIFKSIFHGIFGWTDHVDFWPSFHVNKYFLLAVILVVAVAIQKRQRAN